MADNLFTKTLKKQQNLANKTNKLTGFNPSHEESLNIINSAIGERASQQLEYSTP